MTLEYTEEESIVTNALLFVYHHLVFIFFIRLYAAHSLNRLITFAYYPRSKRIGF